MTFYPDFQQSSREFVADYPLNTLCDASNNTKETLLNNINKKIIKILDNLIEHNTPLDVAFIKINVLVCYATDGINQLFPNASDDIFMGYLKFLFHFIIFGCMFGKQYSKYIVLNTENNEHDYETNEILTYLNHNIIPKLDSRCIKYKYNHSQRHTIIESATKCLKGCVDIAALIADFTAHTFEQFAFEIILCCCYWACSKNNNTITQLSTIYNHYELGHGYLPLIVPKLLMCPRFISYHDTNLEYFINSMLFKSISFNPIEEHSECIATLYSVTSKYCMTIRPWTDSIEFIELFEQLARQYIHNNDTNDTNDISEYITNVFAKCIDTKYCDNKQPLSIFYNGNNEFMEQISYSNITNEILNTIYENVDDLFTDFIDKYFSNNKYIMNNMLYQMINSLIFFESVKEYNLKINEQLLDKLIDKFQICMDLNVLRHIDLDAFRKTKQYKQSLDTLQNISMQYQKFSINQASNYYCEPPLKKMKLNDFDIFQN